MSEIKLSREYVEQGYSYAEVRRLGRSGDLVRVRRGAWAAPVETDDARSAHRRLVEATVRQCSPEAVVSHVSAAALHGLPLFCGDLDLVCLTRDRAGGGDRRTYVRLYGNVLPAVDITALDGIPVTSLARTVVDVACMLPPFRAVPVGDAALRKGLRPAELRRSLRRAGRRVGIRSARRTIGMLDARSESVGESCSRVVFRDHGIPDPVPQLQIVDGDFVAWVDFAWPERGTIGEFDGKQKYGLVPEGKTAADILWEEKIREDRLRALGWEVVRWIWDDLINPSAFLRRLNAAFERGAAR